MPRSLPVRDVMTTDVLSVAPTDAVEDAMAALVRRGVDAAPVIDPDGVVVGLLSTGDLIVSESQVHVPTVLSILGATIELPGERKRFEEDLRRAVGGTVADVMTPDPHTVGPDATVEDAATLLIRVDPEDLELPADRMEWAPEGLVAYSKICTHVGCPVGLYRESTHELVCPCHQSTFNVLRGAEPVFGPATRPLPQLPIAVDDDGYVVATGDYPEPTGPGFWNWGT